MMQSLKEALAPPKTCLLLMVKTSFLLLRRTGDSTSAIQILIMVRISADLVMIMSLVSAIMEVLI
jgi:hypothetical protein